jgi:pilus assembly protein CpaF
MEADMIVMLEIFRFVRSGVDERGAVLGRFSATGIVPDFYDRIRKRGIELPITVFSADQTTERS